MRENNDIKAWLHFFLDGISETADQGVKTFDAILKFQRDWELNIGSWKSQSASGLSLFKYLFTQPIVSAAKVAEVASISNLHLDPTRLENYLPAIITRRLTRKQCGIFSNQFFPTVIFQIY